MNAKIFRKKFIILYYEYSKLIFKDLQKTFVQSLGHQVFIISHSFDEILSISSNLLKTKVEIHKV